MATVDGAYALGLEGRLGAIRPGLRADLVLVRYAGGDPYEAVLTATDDDTRAAWVNGRAVLVSGLLDEVPIDRECVTLPDVSPGVCGLLDAFGLSAESFGDYIKDAVPLNDAGRQAPCETAH